MAKSKLIKQTKADPFDFNRLYGNEKYSLSNMTMVDAGLPDLVEPGMSESVYSDRLRQWHKDDVWYGTIETLGIKSSHNADAWWAGVSTADVLKFAQEIAKIIGFKHPVTGARIVRFTDGGQYPIYRLDMASGGSYVPKNVRMVRGHVILFDDDGLGIFNYGKILK